MPSYLDLAHWQATRVDHGLLTQLKLTCSGSKTSYSSGPGSRGLQLLGRGLRSGLLTVREGSCLTGTGSRGSGSALRPSRTCPPWLWPVVSCHSAVHQWIGPSESGQALAANQLLSVTVALPLPSHCHASGTML